MRKKTVFPQFFALTDIKYMEKEIEYGEIKKLSKEIINNLDTILNRIEIENFIAIKYYKNGRYNEINGTVTKIDY